MVALDAVQDHDRRIELQRELDSTIRFSHAGRAGNNDEVERLGWARHHKLRELGLHESRQEMPVRIERCAIVCAVLMIYVA